MTKRGSGVGTLVKRSKIDFKAVRHGSPLGQSCLSRLSSPTHCTSEPSRSTSIPYIWTGNKLGINCL